MIVVPVVVVVVVDEPGDTVTFSPHSLGPARALGDEGDVSPERRKGFRLRLAISLEDADVSGVEGGTSRLVEDAATDGRREVDAEFVLEAPESGDGGAGPARREKFCVCKESSELFLVEELGILSSSGGLDGWVAKVYVALVGEGIADTDGGRKRGSEDCCNGLRARRELGC